MKRCRKKSPKKNIDATPKVPPCAEFLGNSIPLVIDDLILFNNQNRLYVFLLSKPLPTSTLKYSLSTNIQISFANFIIASYVDAVINNNIDYDSSAKIHEDSKFNEFIHSAIRSTTEFKETFIPALGLLVSNSNAILPLINYSQDISYVTYILIYMLHAFEKNPALFYGNNNYIFDNIINVFLASNNIILKNFIISKYKPHKD